MIHPFVHSLLFDIHQIRANKERWNINEKPPHTIQPVKGSVHVTLNRKVVEYVINNDVAADFLKWVNKTSIPDETFFATLIHNPELGIPGSFKGNEIRLLLSIRCHYGFF